MFFVLAGIASLLLLVAGVVALAIFVARRSARDFGRTLRRLFQYGLLLTLVILVATGLTGLLARSDPDVDAGPGYMAFMLSCVIVGIPALVLVAAWVRRTVGAEGEADPLWDTYLVAAELIGLITATVGGSIWGEALARGRFDGAAAAVLLVWGIVWLIHHAMVGRRGRSGRLRYGVLLGSLTGLVTACSLGALFLSGILEEVYDAIAGTVVLAEGRGEFPRWLVGVVIGGAVWVYYWWLLGLRRQSDPLWRAYTLLVVVGGLFTALTGVWNFAYLVLDWFVWEPVGPAGLHFEELPLGLALVIVGGGVWRYHRAVLRPGSTTSRIEVDRVHDYTVAGAGLVATMGGLAAVIAASIQALLPADLLYHPSDRSGLIAAVTVLLVGAPLWWRYWSSTQRMRREGPEEELGSPSRRIYLICLFGIGGVVALVSLLVLVYRITERALVGGVGTETLFSIRWPLGVAVTVGITASYHWAIRRADVAEMPAEPVPVAVRSVVLVGSGGRQVAKVVEEQTGVEVKIWNRAETEVPLSADEAVEAIESADHEHLLIVARPDGLEVIPYTE